LAGHIVGSAVSVGDCGDGLEISGILFNKLAISRQDVWKRCKSSHGWRVCTGCGLQPKTPQGYREISYPSKPEQTDTALPAICPSTFSCPFCNIAKEPRINDYARFFKNVLYLITLIHPSGASILPIWIPVKVSYNF
jgi:hypothetical protein